MDTGLFSGFEAALRKWLHRQFGTDWCEARRVQQRTFNDLVHDPEIRPQMAGFTHEAHRAVVNLAARAEVAAESRRLQRLDEYGIGGPEWGNAIPLVEPPEMTGFETVDHLPELEAAIQATRNWAIGVKDADLHTFYPPFLVLNGVPGCGKTKLAKAACHMLWMRPAVLFTVEADMVLLLHQAIPSKQVEAVAEELMSIPALIYDDYGAAALTPGSWAHGKRDEIISYRYEHELRTMITTNLKSSEINANSPRLGSRMMDVMKAVNVAIPAGNYRTRRR